jgi:hypothetical protein
MKIIGKIRKNVYATNLCLIAKSWMPELKVVFGIKRLFMTSIEMIYSGIINHHKLKTVLSLAFEIVFASISWCFN